MITEVRLLFTILAIDPSLAVPLLRTPAAVVVGLLSEITAIEVWAMLTLPLTLGVLFDWLNTPPTRLSLWPLIEMFYPIILTIPTPSVELFNTPASNNPLFMLAKIKEYKIFTTPPTLFTTAKVKSLLFAVFDAEVVTKEWSMFNGLLFKFAAPTAIVLSGALVVLADRIEL